jgi:hypothetical protein
MTDKSRLVRLHKSTNDLPITITMMAELIVSPAVLIQQINTALVVGSLVHVLSEAAVEGFC